MHSKFGKLNEDVLNVFKNIKCTDETGEAHKVPVVWREEIDVDKVLIPGRKEGESFVVDRINLPMMCLSNNTITPFDPKQPNLLYKLKIYSLFQEISYQIIEQILLLFDNKGTLKVESFTRVKQKEVKQKEELFSSNIKVDKWVVYFNLDGNEVTTEEGDGKASDYIA